MWAYTGMPMLVRTSVLCVVLIFVFFPGRAWAATFCIVGPGVPAQCYYDDVKNCVQAAHPPSTYCQINPDADLIYHGSSRYCTVQSDRLAECLYVDRVECNAIAAHVNGVCFDRNLLNDNVNPFRFDDRIQE